MSLEWRQEYELGFQEIDAQHRSFVEALNRLYQAVYNSESRQSVSAVLADIHRYADQHFATEERYFDQFAYEGAEEHRQAHREFSKKLAVIEADFAKQTMDISGQLVDFLEDWLVGHVLLMDKKYEPCFRQHGLK